MKWLYLLVCIEGIVLPSLAQYDSNLVFGLKAGISQSSISQLSPIFVSEDYYTGYSFNEEKQLKPAVLLFVNYRINPSRIALEGHLGYFQQAAQLVYSDIKDFSYTTRFQYHYLGVGGYVKTLIVRGFNLGVGMRMGINLTPDNISYTSNSTKISWPGNNAPPSDSETQEELRSVIKGMNTTGFGLIASYEFSNGLSLDLSYHIGLNDMIETLVNRHGFIDSNNRASSLQLTIGYAITVDGSKNDKRSGK